MHDRGHLSGFGKKKKTINNQRGMPMDVGSGVNEDSVQKVRLLSDQKALHQQNLSRAIRTGDETLAKKAKHDLGVVQRGLDRHVAACSSS